jgi:hypothetical protein
MKRSSKGTPVFRYLVLGTIIGTLVWEIIERLLSLASVEIDLSVGPVGFDVEVLAIWLSFNPGSLLGMIPAAFLARKA